MRRVQTRKMNLLRLIMISMALYIFPCKGEELNAETILVRYGYMMSDTDPDRSRDFTPDMVQAGIKKFQKFNGLMETGHMDKDTMKLMGTSRCGNVDYINGSVSSFTSVSAWTKKILTWAVKNYSKTSNLTTTQQSDILTKAFDHWSNVSGLSFNKVTDYNSADIKMSFEKREHGDENAFDGRGNILGHAFYPNRGSYAGNVHFDEDEMWTANAVEGTNLEFVAVHELGHALGLAHSSNTKSVMAPFYRGYNKNFQLASDDIKGIQSLYGESTTSYSINTSTTLPDRSTTYQNSTASHQVISLLIPVLCLKTYVDLVP